MSYDHLRQADLNLLVTFCALMEERTISGAARRLLLTQSAMSRAFDRLQAMFKDELLVSTPHGYHPTQRALDIYSELQRMFPKLANMLGDYKFDPAKATGVFTIETSDWGATVLLPGLICMLNKRAPGIQIDVVPRRIGFDRLEAHEVDLVLGPGDSLSQFDSATLRSELVLKDRLVCLMRSGHPLAKGRLTLKDYANAQHIVISPMQGRGHRRISFLTERQPRVAEALKRLGRKPQAKVGFPYFLPLGLIVGNSDLIVTLPLHMARCLETSRTRIVRGPSELGVATYHQVWHSRNDITPVHVWIRELLRSLARQVSKDLRGHFGIAHGRVLGLPH
jgi:DNA-binding transcriptional LysR family regulator